MTSRTHLPHTSRFRYLPKYEVQHLQNVVETQVPQITLHSSVAHQTSHHVGASVQRTEKQVQRKVYARPQRRRSPGRLTDNLRLDNLFCAHLVLQFIEKQIYFSIDIKSVNSVMF